MHRHAASHLQTGAHHRRTASYTVDSGGKSRPQLGMKLSPEIVKLSSLPLSQASFPLHLFVCLCINQHSAHHQLTFIKLQTNPSNHLFYTLIVFLPLPCQFLVAQTQSKLFFSYQHYSRLHSMVSRHSARRTWTCRVC